MDFPERDEFRKWLLAKPRGAVIAKFWSCTRCPLAIFLGDIGAADPYVRPGIIASESCWVPNHVDRNSPRAPMPPWANRFALRIDRRGRKNGPNDYTFGPVTREECLAALRPSVNGL